ncbi:MAG TPA: FtsW/RodA/SpoVE family cell cycle protein [Myxococcota bacterium]|nr:FtsW/RodA/SpoVE family cell cycle protein [Myxococcota bacterium]
MNGRRTRRSKDANGRAVRRTRRRGPVGDSMAWPDVDGAAVTATATLALLGLLMVYSATATRDLERLVPAHFVRQLGACLAGVIVAVGAARVPLAGWQRAAFPLWIAGVTLLAATLLLGVEVNGAQRWLAVPILGLTFQPVEIAKWATVVAVAAWLAPGSGRVTPAPRRIYWGLAMAALPAGLLLLQPDLGNAVLILGVVTLLLFVAGAPARYFAVPAGAGLLAFGVHLAVHPYAWRRIVGFLDPWATADREGFQLVQSFVGFGRGGLFGVGLGDGRQKLFYLPEAHTDFILSLVAEELGLVGVLVVLGAFAALLVSGTRIARRAHSQFAALLAFGMTALLVVPAVVNAAVVTGVVPTKGMALPFLSYGRTGAVMSFAALGVLLGVGLRDARPRWQAVRGAGRRGTWRR